MDTHQPELSLWPEDILPQQQETDIFRAVPQQ